MPAPVIRPALPADFEELYEKLTLKLDGYEKDSIGRLLWQVPAPGAQGFDFEKQLQNLSEPARQAYDTFMEAREAKDGGFRARHRQTPDGNFVERVAAEKTHTPEKPGEAVAGKHII